jgi:hypothetical protein
MSEPSRGWRVIVVAYAIGAGLVLLGSGLFVACQQNEAKEAAAKRHAARTAVAEAKERPAGAPAPIEVRTGVYIDRIPNIGFQDASWTVDFYVWFNWHGAGIEPGKEFQVVDGAIDSNETLSRYDNGDDHYELHRVTATFTKVFDITRFPTDDHVLTISIEDVEHGSEELVFIPDVEGSEISSRVKVPGYVTGKATMVVKDHAYKTTRGDPRFASDHVATHSQLIYAIPIHRPDWSLFLKLFLTMWVAVAVSMLVFFIKPTDVDARFGLSVGALFAVMANAYVIQGSLPAASGLCMADLLTGMSTLTLLLTLGQSTLALTLCHREHEDLARTFDRLTFASLTLAFVIINIAIPLAASN